MLQGKKIKKISFVERKLWEELITGKKLRVKESQLQECFLLADGGDEYQDTPYRTQVNQRVKVPLDGRADAEPFFFEWTFFHEDAGLYCLLQAPVNIQDELVTLFRLLGECGIGTDKKRGRREIRSRIRHSFFARGFRGKCYDAFCRFIPRPKPKFLNFICRSLVTS